MVESQKVFKILAHYLSQLPFDSWSHNHAHFWSFLLHLRNNHESLKKCEIKSWALFLVMKLSSLVSWSHNLSCSFTCTIDPSTRAKNHIEGNNLPPNLLPKVWQASISRLVVVVHSWCMESQEEPHHMHHTLTYQSLRLNIYDNFDKLRARSNSCWP